MRVHTAQRASSCAPSCRGGEAVRVALLMSGVLRQGSTSPRGGPPCCARRQACLETRLGGKVSRVSDEPPPDDVLGHFARQIGQLRQAGAKVVLSPDALAPDVLGTLSQQMPNGPLIVHVDATKSLAQQSAMLVKAFEFIFNEPPLARWTYKSAPIRDGQILNFRHLDIHVDP